MESVDLVLSFRRAVEAEDFDRIIRLVERHWVYLFRADSELLRRATSMVPRELARRHPALTLLDHWFEPPIPGLRSSSDHAIAQLTEIFDRPGDHDVDDQARVSLGLLGMLGLRRRGALDQAADLGARVAALTDLTYRGHAPDNPMPAGVQLQLGIVHLVLGDLEQSERCFGSAFRRRSPFANHAVDAAGKIALIKAMQGESYQAEVWASRAHALEPAASDWWCRSMEHTALAAAEALVALDRLDWSAFHRHHQRADSFAPHDDSAFLLYARAQAALLAGHQRSMLSRIRQFRDEAPQHVPDRSLTQIALSTAQADLRMGLGRLDDAEELISGFGQHPLELITAARFWLLIRQPERAERFTDESTWPDDINRRARVNLLLLAVTCDVRLRAESSERIRLARRIALEIAGDPDAWMFTLALADRDVVELLPRYAPELGDVVRHLQSLDPVRPFTPVRQSIKLTQRERLVLQQIALDLPINGIAASLHVSPATIKNQRKSLYRKLGATSRGHALEIAQRLGLIGPGGRELRFDKEIAVVSPGTP